MIVPEDLTPHELDEITTTVFTLYRYDFRQYAKASLKRRLLRILHRFQMDYAGFLHSLKTKPTFIHQFITELTVNVTEMFRDPFVFQAIKDKIIPLLREKETIRIWHAGCSTGEEVMSMAILMELEGLLDRTSFLGTDLNPLVLNQAKRGSLLWKNLEEFNANFQAVYPEENLDNWFTRNYEYATARTNLRKHCTYQVHDLVTGTPPGKFDLIICRNVYIYFEIGLQEKVLKLLHDSLTDDGLLCLGSKETIRFTSYAKKFDVLDLESRLFQKNDE